jgi:DNA processing protein
VPGSIFSDLSLGPNALLRLGARPVLTARDILEAIGVSDQLGLAASPSSTATTDLSEGVVQLARGEELTVDELAARGGVAVQEMLLELLKLELEGKVERLEDGRYSLRG